MNLIYYNLCIIVGAEIMDDTFGKRLKSLRLNKNLQQKEAAIELGMSHTGYSSYENDSRMPGLKMLIKLADYYSVSIDFLLGRDEKTYVDKNEIEKQIEILKSELNTRICVIEKYLDKTK